MFRLRSLQMTHNNIKKYFETGCAITNSGKIRNAAILKISEDTMSKIRKDKNGNRSSICNHNSPGNSVND